MSVHITVGWSWARGLWYHDGKPLENKAERLLKFLHPSMNCVTAYPVAPHPPTGFVPAPAQPATYGGEIYLFD